MIKTFKRKHLKASLFYYGMALIPLLQFVIFYVFVNVNSVMLAFKEYDYSTGAHAYIGFANFKSIYVLFTTGSVLKIAVKNSLILYICTMVVGVTLALLFSFYIYKKGPLSHFFRVILFMPSIISAIVMSLMFRYFTDKAIPIVLEKLFHVSSDGLIADPRTTFPTAVFYTIVFGFGANILLYVGTMSAINESLVEACKLDGCNLIKEFFHVTLPCIWPTITTFLIAGMAGVFTNQMNLFNFFGTQAEPKVVTIGYYLYKETSEATISGYPQLSAFGLILTAIVVPITLIARWLLQQFGPGGDRGAT